MSDNKEKPARTVAEIQAEYGQMCSRAGHVQYQIFTLEKDLAMLNEALRDLNLEAAKVQAEEVKKKSAEAAEAKAKESGIVTDGTQVS